MRHICSFYSLDYSYLCFMLIANVVYLTYSLLWTSPNVLITTETKAESGDALEFNTMEEVLEKANAMF